MKLGQNVCLDKISDQFENGSCGSKSRSLGQILEKPYVGSRGHIFCQIIMKVGLNVCLDKIHFVSKTSSVGQILEKPCVHSKGHIFSLIIVKLGQNV